MSDEPKRRRSRWWSCAWIGWTLLAVFVAYPLSIGPATALLERVNSPSAWRVYHLAYGPLWWAVEPSESLTTLLMRYICRWDPVPPL
jgi:hypothetical protein